MDRFPKKPCRFCGERGHFSYLCNLNPKKKKYLKSQGKYTRQWTNTRNTWIKKHPPDYRGYWECYLQIDTRCPRYIDLQQLTLDHVKARSRDPSKRFDQNNLQPACYFCNEKKGSKDLEEII